MILHSPSPSLHDLPPALVRRWNMVAAELAEATDHLTWPLSDYEYAGAVCDAVEMDAEVLHALLTARARIPETARVDQAIERRIDSITFLLAELSAIAKEHA